MYDDALYMMAKTCEHKERTDWVDTHGWERPAAPRPRTTLRKAIAQQFITFARWLDPSGQEAGFFASTPPVNNPG